MHLFANELSTSDAIRDEVDLGIDSRRLRSRKRIPPACPAERGRRRRGRRDARDPAQAREPEPQAGGRRAPRACEPRAAPYHAPLGLRQEPAVAVPVLRYSELLSAEEIAAIARLRGTRVPSQDHLTAIASRRDLCAHVTDILTQSGSREVLETLARNDTAKFSLLGLCRLAMRAYRDCAAGDGRLSDREWSV